ncbi:nitrogen fixation protein NifU [Desulfonispora thiosulfatigenes DSM 11270]|uniref:Nitrogen fixation protein NifU n=1 Tax=Desulfonispora thiosulfatigenes DSM 11270 TaxID=656914 RepID=A0A1W1V6T7_DESTI|nr:iron-sulfur cluster assembly scaffold protein [Desulfonispora thiosulfatigenes]SMB89127.1 nitrogen fixation protein NifU [Desulfonispora thiosulfatigenes DSM 11270]
MYNEKVIEYAKNPRNQGGMDNPDAVGEISNPDCGDATTIFLKVENNIIVDVKFDTFGCAAAVATSSKLTEMVKGKSIDDALEITDEMVADELGGLPLKKMHCSNIGIDALREAIKEYKENN